MYLSFPMASRCLDMCSSHLVVHARSPLRLRPSLSASPLSPTTPHVARRKRAGEPPPPSPRPRAGPTAEPSSPHFSVQVAMVVDGTATTAGGANLSGARGSVALPRTQTHARILVSYADAGCIIGKAGSDIHAMEARSGAHIKLSGRGRPLPGTDRRFVLVSGLFRTVMDAAELILEKLFYLGDQVIDAEATVVLVVPDACCRALICKGGEVIKSTGYTSDG